MNTLKRLLATTALVGAVAAPTAASAANVAAVPLKCGTVSNCYILTVDGKIMPDDDKKFEAVINKNDVRVAVVALNSPGGNLLSGLAIGNSIREHGYTTIVPSNMLCGSVCAAMWLAGSTRQVEVGARIGFHAAFAIDQKGRVIGTSGMGNALVGSYYARLGLSDPAIAYMTVAGPSGAQWLNPTAAQKYGIAVTVHEPKTMLVVGPWPKTAEALPPLPPEALPTVKASDTPKLHDCRTAGTCTPNPDPVAPARHDCRVTGTCTEPAPPVSECVTIPGTTSHVFPGRSVSKALDCRHVTPLEMAAAKRVIAQRVAAGQRNTTEE